MRFLLRLVLPTFCFAAPTALAAADNFPVTIRVDAAKSCGELKPIYRFFGADEPNYAVRAIDAVVRELR